MHKVEEKDLVGYEGSLIPVRVLATTGTTARVITKRAGVHVTGDQIYEVPISALQDDRNP
ncbi:hypothetical protein [Streptomyces sp. ME19-01-6]|uniref:hypothetical protein n=1 Tax=Streptomyces sp. ME19-01-6 TaxID=3028686 RepID=UPI0029A98EBE|nr:hypothetical protein [Streptomyces sp. ME19-01-6]MDX3230608.1 hypothetical protein [Streptomyces sp. ME19-01-6]